MAQQKEAAAPVSGKQEFEVWDVRRIQTNSRGKAVVSYKKLEMKRVSPPITSEQADTLNYGPMVNSANTIFEAYLPKGFKEEFTLQDLFPESENPEDNI